MISRFFLRNLGLAFALRKIYGPPRTPNDVLQGTRYRGHRDMKARMTHNLLRSILVEF